MIQLMKYFLILFMDTHISKARLKQFTSDHLIRLTDHNPGAIYNTLITDTTAAATAYFGDYAGELDSLSSQEGDTQAMDNARAALTKNIGNNSNYMKYLYQDDITGKYEKFYPRTMEEYDKASLEDYIDITNRYLNKLTEFTADFDPAFITAFTNLHTAFNAAYTLQHGDFSAVAGERGDQHITRPTLCKQLTKNLLVIASNNVGLDFKAGVYFDQSILNEAFAESERKLSNVDINPGDTQNAFLVTQSTVHIKVKNNGTTPLYIKYKPTADTVVIAEDGAIQAGQELTVTAMEGGWNTNTRYLNLTCPAAGSPDNPDGLVGNYTIEKV
jgi:hypothetical protein